MNLLSHRQRSSGSDGFALVITMSLVILLMVVGVGLLSLASVTIRQSGTSEAAARARDNARLGLLVALGELQRHLGPDKSVSASAAVLDSDPDTPAVEGVAMPNLTGVWQSWTIDPNNATAPDYRAEKRNRFRSWLVSGLDATAAANPDTPKALPWTRTDPKAVSLLGAGSLGKTAAESQHMWAGKVDLNRPGQAFVDSRYAYAVLDEGSKARIDLSRGADTATTLADRLANAAMPGDTGLEQLANLSSFAARRDQRGRMVTVPDAHLLLAEDATTTKELVKPYSHALTTWSTGVLADVANGGLRRDFSTLALNSRLPSPLAGTRLYSGTSTPLGGADRGTGAYRGGSADPKWEFLFNRIRNTTSQLRPYRTSFPALNTTTKPRDFFPDADTGSPAVLPSRDAQADLPFAPVMVRCELIFSLFVKDSHGTAWRYELNPGNQATVARAFGKDASTPDMNWNYMLHLVYTPVVTLWNPYSVPLVVGTGSAGGNPVVEIENPPIGFQWIRQKSLEARHQGDVINRVSPLDEMYVNAGQKYNKRFVMELYGELRGTTPSGPVFLEPGEVKVFSPVMDPNWLWGEVFDWQNNRTDLNSSGAIQIKAAPGWRGPQYGYNIDWLVGKPEWVNSGKNGHIRTIGVMGSTLSDLWDARIEPKLQQSKGAASTFGKYTVSMRLGNPSTNDPTGELLSRLEFDFNQSETVLKDAMKASSSYGVNSFPFQITSYLPPVDSRKNYVRLTDPMKSWVVQPFLVLTAQAKTTTDAAFPSLAWIHNNPTRPISYIDLSRENQAWTSHELALLKYESGMATDPKVDGATGRGYFFSGSFAFNGSQYGTQREIPVLPWQSLAQLSSLDLTGSSGYLPSFNNPVGSSFAHPLLPAEQVMFKDRRLAYSLLDHSWLANTRLWDSWYFSTISAYSNPRGSTFFAPEQAGTAEVVATRFFRGEDRLFNPRLVPWKSQGNPESIAKTVTSTTGTGWSTVAAYQMLEGAFNVNSASPEAWKALLSGLAELNLPVLEPKPNPTGAAVNESLLKTPAQGAYLSPFSLPNRPNANKGDNSSIDGRARLWQGGRQLTPEQLDSLANAIANEVKRRGPFLSLAEFVNRQVGSPSELTRRGALQAAIDKADQSGAAPINAGSADAFAELSPSLTTPQISKASYNFAEAGTGPTALGAPGRIDQLSILSRVGSLLSARSDTFRIRSYGEALDAKGSVVARAWLEAVVQRVPDLIDRTDSAETAPAAMKSQANKTFGRRFHVVATRWLAPNEV